MKIIHLLPLLITCGFVSQSYCEDKVITDATRTSGANAIDANYVVNYIANEATAESTLEDLTGFAAIHDFEFQGNQSTTDNYIFNFTDANVPDIQLNYTAGISGSTVAVNNTYFRTSDDSSMRVQSSDLTSSVGFTIQLGKYDTRSRSFSSYTAAGQGVSALGFTLSGARFNLITAAGITITYYDAVGRTLSTQTFAPIAGQQYGYTGYKSTGAPIASVSVNFVGNSTSMIPLFGLDDLGTTTIRR